MTPARGLNLSAVEGPETTATMAGTPLGVPGLGNTHHDCSGQGSSGSRTWQLPAASPLLTSGAGPAVRPAAAQEPPGSNALCSDKGSGLFQGQLHPSLSPAPLCEERADLQWGSRFHGYPEAMADLLS